MRAVFAILFVLLTATPVAATFGEEMAAREQYSVLLAYSECLAEKVYNAKSTDAPAPIAAVLAGPASFLVFTTCTDFYKNVHYFVRVPLRNPGGVCRVFKDELFVSTTADDHVAVSKPRDMTKPVDSNDWKTESWVTLTGWTDRVPEAWRLAGYERKTAELATLVESTASACPAVTDPRYMVMNATDGMFKGFMRLWRKVTASRQAFDHVFRTVRESDAEFNPTLNPEEMRADLRRRIFDDHEVITEINCKRGGGFGTGCNALLNGWYWIHFDVGESGRLEIMSFREDPEDGPL